MKKVLTSDSEGYTISVEMKTNRKGGKCMKQGFNYDFKSVG